MIEEVKGTIIGGEDHVGTFRVELHNEATGTIMDFWQFCPSEHEAKLWAERVIQARRDLWKGQFKQRYPLGFELRMYGRR